MSARITLVSKAVAVGLLWAIPAYATTDTASHKGLGVGLMLFVLFVGLIISVQVVPGFLLFFTMLRDLFVTRKSRPALEGDGNRPA